MPASVKEVAVGDENYEYIEENSAPQLIYGSGGEDDEEDSISQKNGMTSAPASVAEDGIIYGSGGEDDEEDSTSQKNRMPSAPASVAEDGIIYGSGDEQGDNCTTADEIRHFGFSADVVEELTQVSNNFSIPLSQVAEEYKAAGSDYQLMLKQLLTTLHPRPEAAAAQPTAALIPPNSAEGRSDSAAFEEWNPRYIFILG